MRHTLLHELSEGDLEAGRNAEARTALQCFAQRLQDDGSSVSEDERSPREDVVDVLVAVDVPDACALAACDQGGLASDAAEGADRRAHAAGKERAGTRHELV